jgi:hypothetical protein
MPVEPSFSRCISMSKMTRSFCPDKAARARSKFLDRLLSCR